MLDTYDLFVVIRHENCMYLLNTTRRYVMFVFSKTLYYLIETFLCIV